MSDEQHIALPHLYGGPAYSRPPRPVAEIPRPFDPDELPLEAERTEQDAALVAQLTGTEWVPTAAPKGRRSKPGRGRAAKTAKAQPAGSAPAAGATQATGTGGLQGRPFRLRGLGRILRGDHK